MIFKTKRRLTVIAASLAVAGTLQCSTDPANSGWGADGEVTIRNHYSSIRPVVQDSGGRFYALSYYQQVLTFDEHDFLLNRPPDTLPLPDEVRNIALDANNELFVCCYDGARLVRPAGDGFSVIDIDTTLSGLRIVNIDKKIIRATTNSGKILSWDGLSLKNHGILPIDGDDIRGIFADSNGINVFVSYGMGIHRYIIKDSDVTQHFVIADSCRFYSIFKIGEKLFADGTLCGGAISDCINVRFEIRPDNSINVFDTLASGFNHYAQGSDAVYLMEYRSIVKITATACLRASIVDNIDGSFYINRSGRAALMYRPTRRIFPVDSLDFTEFARW